MMAPDAPPKQKAENSVKQVATRITIDGGTINAYRNPHADDIHPNNTNWRIIAPG